MYVCMYKKLYNQSLQIVSVIHAQQKNPGISAIVSAGTNQLKAAQHPEGHNLPLSHTQKE